jgi:hypothetical protein
MGRNSGKSGRAKRQAGLPARSKELLRGRKGRKITMSPSQPHSKTVGR